MPIPIYVGLEVSIAGNSYIIAELAYYPSMGTRIWLENNQGEHYWESSEGLSIYYRATLTDKRLVYLYT